MDSIIKSYPFTEDEDLRICEGVAYQKDMKWQVDYDQEYFELLKSYEDTDIALKINKGRIALVNLYHKGFVLDVGVGSGEFIRKRPMTMGYDINPFAVEWLKSQALYSEDLKRFRAFTFWDVIEHIIEPAEYFDRMPVGSHLFTSIPIFRDLTKIRQSKHYRPDEHYYYFTKDGLIEWMGKYGFESLITQQYEIAAGRDSIYSFAFRKW